jgi:hypothetical protein
VKKNFAIALFCAVFYVAFSAAQTVAPSSGMTSEQYVSMAPAKKLTVAAGRPAVLELDFRVREGLHVNSNTPKSEYLIPTRLRFMPPTDLAVTKTEYPAGQELALSFQPKEKLSVYTGDFRITALVNASRSATTGPYTVHGELKYQACNDKACFPPKTLPIAFNIVVAKAAAGNGGVSQKKEPSTQHNPAQSPHIRR